MGRGLGEEFPEPCVAQASRGFFDSLPCFGGFGGRIDVGRVDRDVETGAEVAAELLVSVGFGAAQAVVQVGGMDYEAQLSGPLVEREQQRDRVRSPGEGDGNAHAGAKERGVEWEGGGHGRIIAGMQAQTAVG